VSNWRDMTWDAGWDQAHFLGGYVGVGTGLFLGMFRSNPGGIWRLRENPANQRLEFSFWASIPPATDPWSYLESFIGPDQPP